MKKNPSRPRREGLSRWAAPWGAQVFSLVIFIIRMMAFS